MEKARVAYWDALRGFGVFLVVYHHFIVMGMRDSGYTSQVNVVLSSFFMPLFFFISGYFASKTLDDSGYTKLMKYVLKNMRRLVFPSVFMFAFCLIYYHLPLQKYIFDSYKCGYWFAIVLFLCHVMAYIVCFLMRGKKTLIVNMLFSLFIYYSCSGLNTNNALVSLTSLNLFASNYLFFVGGLVYKTYIERIFMRGGIAVLYSIGFTWLFRVFSTDKAFCRFFADSSIGLPVQAQRKILLHIFMGKRIILFWKK